MGFIFGAFVTIFAEKAKIPPKGGSGVFVYPGLRSVNLPHPGLFVFDPFRVGGWCIIREFQLLHPVASYPVASRHSGLPPESSATCTVPPQVIEEKRRRSF
ncbi:MAG: hypothetical protein ACQES1_11410, partial [Bacteroidota bacterium]